MPPSVDPGALVPGLDVGDALRFVAYLALVVWLPGSAIYRLLGLRSGGRFERWAETAVLGVLWVSLLYFALGLVGLQRWHLAPVWLPVVGVWSAATRRRFSGRVPLKAIGEEKRRPAVTLPRRGWTAAQVIGLLLIAAMVANYLARVDSCIQYDASGLRLYGAFFTDKMTNMSPCAALIHDVPPRNLRFSGSGFPYHYFPHVFVAALSQTTGIDYVNGFWFYAAALGIAITGLTVLAFCRRMLHSSWLACLGLLFFGWIQFNPETKPLDLSIGLLLLGLLALERYRASGRRRWAALAVGMLGAMPLYEVFHAAAALGGLAVWSAAGARAGWRELRWRIAVTGPAGLLAPIASFHRIDRDRLEALAFLRGQIPFGDVVIHPWVDDLICDDREPDKVNWVYKRHFTLGSNLAGQQMYYEGRADHLFIGGFILPEEVDRRSRLRKQFYESPDRATVDAVVGRGPVGWVVADREHPAPPPVAAGWELAFANATVRIYRRPPLLP
jgi:hypothetical protein